jgi:hypothetical protein
MSHLAIEDLQHPGCELRRIYLLGTRVNMGKEKSSTAEERGRRRFVIMRCDGTLLRDDGHKPADPQLPVDRLANIVREAILPSVEALIPLRAQGRLVTGGTWSGRGPWCSSSRPTQRKRCARCSKACRYRAWPRPRSAQCGPWENCTPSRSSRTPVSCGCEHPGSVTSVKANFIGLRKTEGQLLRKPLPRTRVNKGKRAGGSYPGPIVRVCQLATSSGGLLQHPSSS